MEDLLFFAQSFVAFFVIVDAIGNVPIFISLLSSFTEEDRKLMIKRAITLAFLTLVAVSFTGEAFFNLLGVQMYSFRIAGGILLMIIALEMLFGRKSRTETSEDIEERKQDLTITPLAVPLLTGPGAMTTGIVLFNSATDILQRVYLIISMALVFILSYLILAHARGIFNFLGRTGTKVVIRVMGLMLMSVSVQFVITGISEAIPNIL